MRDIDLVAMSTITEPIKRLNKHIERLENSLTDVDDDEEYVNQLCRHEWIGELKREREIWIADLKADYGELNAGIRPSKPWPRR